MPMTDEDEEVGPRRDIRAAMLEEGVRLVEESGIDGPASIDTAAALVSADVRRGSTFGKGRIWPQQWHYQVDVLKEVVSKFPSVPMLESFDLLVDDVLAEELSTAKGRAQGLTKLVNHPSNLADLLKTSPEWQLWNAVWACVVSTPGQEDDRQLGEPAKIGYEKLQSVLAKRYGSTLGWLGFSPATSTSDAVLAGIILDLVLGAASTPQTARPADMASAVRALIEAFYTTDRPN